MRYKLSALRIHLFSWLLQSQICNLLDKSAENKLQNSKKNTIFIILLSRLLSTAQIFKNFLLTWEDFYMSNTLRLKIEMEVY